jgi:hypothetical protein
VVGDVGAAAEKGRGVLGRGIEVRERLVPVPCCNPGSAVPRGVIGVAGTGRAVLGDRPGDDIPDDCLTDGISPANPMPFCIGIGVGEDVARLACVGIRNTRPQRGQGPLLASHSLLPQRGQIMLFPSQSNKRTNTQRIVVPQSKIIASPVNIIRPGLINETRK